MININRDHKIPIYYGFLTLEIKLARSLSIERHVLSNNHDKIRLKLLFLRR